MSIPGKVPRVGDVCLPAGPGRHDSTFISVNLVTLHTKYKWDHAVCFFVISIYHLISLRFIHNGPYYTISFFLKAEQYSQVVLVVKNSPANAGDIRDVGSILGNICRR